MMTPKKEIEKNMPLVNAVREKVFPYIAPDHVKAVLDEDKPYIQFGEFNFYPEADKEVTETIAGKRIRSVFTWTMTTWVVVHGGRWEPDDVDEKDIGQFPSVYHCLVEIGRLDYENRISAIGEAIQHEEEEKAEAEYEKYLAEHPQEPQLCPHGKSYIDCDACLYASDMAYDAMRERQRFGR